jgi:hypothetical protein
MKILGYLLIPVLILVACKGKQSDTSVTEENTTQPIKGVCISTGTPLREEPKKEGKWISSMMLGETLTYLGETVADSANPKQDYYKVELSDGKLAWARTYGILINAEPAAIISETPLYKRPDLVTKTDKSFKIVEFVAIIGEKDDWAEVVGAEKRKTGWVKKESLSTNAEDVAVATLAQKDLLDKDGAIQNDKLSAFIESLPDGNSQLARYLQDQMNNRVEGAIEQSIQDYEGQDEGEYIVVDDKNDKQTD